MIFLLTNFLVKLKLFLFNVYNTAGNCYFLFFCKFWKYGFQASNTLLIHIAANRTNPSVDGTGLLDQNRIKIAKLWYSRRQIFVYEIICLIGCSCSVHRKVKYCLARKYLLFLFYCSNNKGKRKLKQFMRVVNIAFCFHTQKFYMIEENKKS